MNLSAVHIPCCLCGTMILPNAANKCGACLATEHNLAALIHRPPPGQDMIQIYQCRECRRFQRTGGTGGGSSGTGGNGKYQAMQLESKELLALCLKAIPALQASAQPRLHIVDAYWIWTEPNSMRFKIHLTVRYTVDRDVQVQQRVKVELKNVWKQCPECNREYTNRTWHAVVQLRQQDRGGGGGGGGGNKTGLAALEMAIRKSPILRQDVLKIDAVKNGMDFYFLQLQQAQAFGHALQRVNPMRIKTSQKLVSTDIHNNTANLKHTLTCELVPVCRHDLILFKKAVTGAKLAGRLVIVDKVSSILSLWDASPPRGTARTETNWQDACQMTMSAEMYYKNEKQIRVLLTANRLIRYVVLDVEVLSSASSLAPNNADNNTTNGDDDLLYQGPKSGISKYALADVLVARESDFGVNDTTFSVVTHLGHLIQTGDIVLGYDLESTVGGDWELDHPRSLHNNFVVPDVVLVKKVTTTTTTTSRNSNTDGDGDNHPSSSFKENDTCDDTTTNNSSKSKLSKKREKRRLRKEGRKQRELEQSAVRMGFFPAEEEEAAAAAAAETEEKDVHDMDDDVAAPKDYDRATAFEEELAQDPELAAELQQLEAAFEEATVAFQNKHDEQEQQQQEEEVVLGQVHVGQEEQKDDDNEVPVVIDNAAKDHDNDAALTAEAEQEHF